LEGWAAHGIVSTWWDNSAAPGTPTYASLVGECYGQVSVTVGSSGDATGVGLAVQLQ